MKNSIIIVLLNFFLWCYFFSPCAIGQKKATMKGEGNTLKKVMDRVDRKHGIFNANKIYTIFYNFGGIGGGGEGGRIQSGIYPKGSGHSYFYEFTPIIAAEVKDANGNIRHIVSDGLIDVGHRDSSPEGYQWGFEPLKGYANPNQDFVAMSDNLNSWPVTWPDRDPSWDGFWNGQYGKYVRATQETYFRMNDYFNDEFEFYPDPDDSSKRGLGLEVEVRGYEWAHPAAEDIIIWTYWITNTGKTTYDKIVFGMYGDADVGGEGDVRDDNSWFDKDNDIVYQWDNDNIGAWGGECAYFGWKFLESPGNPYDGVDNDNDGMIDESQFDGIDNDGDWDPNFDDVGSDGLGPNDPDYPGPDPDGTEGNGKPDLGEPNFEYTDNDESDQIGLTSFAAKPYPDINIQNDELMWKQMIPDYYEVPRQNVDITFLYGSGYFKLEPGEKRKFSVAMLFGDDYDDIIRNGVTMQEIYDADYNFAKPPSKPTVYAVAGDHKVTLYWDKKAELSRDPIYGYDFEGYRIYRSTDVGFIETWTITNAYGSKTYNKPIAQFDKINGLKDLHPIDFQGVKFNIGDDTGLVHTWTDTTVENGQTYYYAVCSYDQGYDIDFYERGLSDLPNLGPICPSECTKIIEIDALGNVTRTDLNTVKVIPNSPSLGYVPPADLSTEDGSIVHETGTGTGKILINTLDPERIEDDNQYSVCFDDTTYEDLLFSVRNDQYLSEEFEADEMWISLVHNHIDLASIEVSDDYGNKYILNTDYAIDAVNGKIRLINGGGISKGKLYQIRYCYYPIYLSPYVNGEECNTFFDGLHIYIWNDQLEVNLEETRWLLNEDKRYYLEEYGFINAGDDIPFQYQGRSNYGVDVRRYINLGVKVPCDYNLVVYENKVTTSYNQKPANFKIFNISLDEECDFLFLDYDENQKISIDDIVVPITKIEGHLKGTWQMKFFSPPPDTIWVDSLIVDSWGNKLDTVQVVKEISDTLINPKAGDIFHIRTKKPFTSNDIFYFQTHRANIDTSEAKSELDKIAVVPNPYVAAASWEPRHYLQSGRGKRMIEFIHLPAKCTIKIFTMRGHLVDTIEHDSLLNDGHEFWDLLSNDNMEIAYGVYLYHISAPGIGEKVGRFAIIK